MAQDWSGLLENIAPLIAMVASKGSPHGQAFTQGYQDQMRTIDDAKRQKALDDQRQGQGAEAYMMHALQDLQGINDPQQFLERQDVYKKFAPVYKIDPAMLDRVQFNDAGALKATQKEASDYLDRMVKANGNNPDILQTHGNTTFRGQPTTIDALIRLAGMPTDEKGAPIIGNKKPKNLQHVLVTVNGQSVYAGFSPEDGKFYGQDGQVIPNAAPVETPKPTKATPAAGTLEDYLSRYAAEKGVDPSELTTADVDAARKRYQLAVEKSVDPVDAQKKKADLELVLKRLHDLNAPEIDVTKLTPEAVALLANQFRATGNMPSLGMGNKAAGTKVQVINQAAATDPNLDVAGRQADFAANKKSLSALQGQRDAMGAFEQTAGKNLDVFLNAAGKVVDSGSPLVNKPLRWVQQNVSGDPNMAAYNAALQTVIPEFGRILSSPGLSGVLSDSARKEVASVIDGNASLAQIVAVARVLRQDVKNRTDSYDAQIREVKGRIGSGNKQDTVDTQVAPPPGQKLKVGRFVVEPQ